MNQKGFVPIVIVIGAILISGVAIGGSFYLNKANIKYPEEPLKFSDTKNVPEATVGGNLEVLNLEPVGQNDKETTKSAILKKLKSKDGLDVIKKEVMGYMAFKVDEFYKKYNQLPFNFQKLDLSYYKDIDPQIDNFINIELKYQILPEGYYNLCAKFSSKTDRLATAYFKEKITSNDPEYQCFKLEIFKQSSSATIVPDPPYKGSTAFADDNIASVKNNAVYTRNSFTTVYTLIGKSNESINKEPGITKEFGHANFPYGFFSDKDDEWGLVADTFDNNSEKSTPLVVKIFFKNPVKLSKISNLFSNCQLKDCYIWQATGINTQGNSVELAKDIQTGKDSKIYSTQIVDSEDEFKELDISVTRTDNTYDRNIVWKKIKLEYK